jgi:hypothetical protein
MYLRLNRSDLALRLGALLQLRHLLSLDGRCCNLLTKDNVSHFADSERCNVDTVAFPKVLDQDRKKAVDELI